jgi:hypothetical protein
MLPTDYMYVMRMILAITTDYPGTQYQGMTAVFQTDCVLCDVQTESLYIIEMSVFKGLKAFTKHEKDRQGSYKHTTEAHSGNHFCMQTQ